MIFETVAQLKLATLTAGQLVSTKGYYASGDGGAADYIVAATQAVDGYGDHALAGGTVALLQVEGSADVKKYGATGDGVTDDTAAIQAAISASAGKVVDFLGGTYAIPTALLLSDKCTVRNGTLLFSNTSCFRAIQSYLTSDSLTGNADLGTGTITIATTAAYSVGDVVKISSDRVWSDDGTLQTTSGELVEILEVTSGTSLTLSAALNDIYSTADAAKVELMSDALTGVTVDNMTLIGVDPTGGQNAIVTARIRDVTVTNCTISDSGKSGVFLEEIYGFLVTGNTMTGCASSGYGYGVVSFSASRSGHVSHNTMSHCRTGYTHGGTGGVGHGLVASNNVCIGCFTAGINSKASSDGMVVSGNYVEGLNTTKGLGDGIRIRGRNAVITGNIVTNCYRFSIYLPIYGAVPTTFSNVTITGNSVINARNIACYVDVNDGNTVKGVVVNGNSFNHIDDASASKGSVHIRCSDGSLNNIAVVGNTVSNCSYNCLDVRTSGTGTISNYISTANVLERNATAIAGSRAAVVTIGATNVDTAGNVTT